MPRLNIERQRKLEPTRIERAKNELIKRGFVITYENETEIQFTFEGETIKFFPYSGWHTGKTIKDGRGFNKLFRQLQKFKI